MARRKINVQDSPLLMDLYINGLPFSLSHSLAYLYVRENECWPKIIIRLLRSARRKIMVRRRKLTQYNTLAEANGRVAWGWEGDAHCERERHYFGTYRALLVWYTLVHTSPEHGERILRYAAVRAEAYRFNSLCYIYWRTGGVGVFYTWSTRPSLPLLLPPPRRNSFRRITQNSASARERELILT